MRWALDLHNRKTFLATFIIVYTTGLAVFWLRFSPTLPTTSRRLPFRFKPQQNEQFPSRLLPYKQWEHRHQYPENYNQITCSNFPRLEDIRYAAAAWQHLQVKNGSVYIYAAHWDNRFDEPLVRLLMYCDVNPLPTLMCQLWYENENSPVVVPSTVTYGWRSEWGGPKDRINEPYILTCSARRHLPYKQKAPAAVSIVRDDNLCGTPTNVLNVQGTPLPEEPAPFLNTSKISVCLKTMHFRDDISAELVEWIELLKALGADKLFVYVVQAHPNTRLVLDYYAAAGFADVTQFENPPQLRSDYTPSEQEFHDLRRELLSLNDCLYRSVNKYPWLTAIDTDELIVPLNFTTWQQIIEAETKGIQGLDAMTFPNYYFLDPAQRDLAAPSYMKKLGHLWRGIQPNPPGDNVKSFHNSSSIVAMHNHYPLSCGPTRDCWSVGAKVARLHHYRIRCNDEQPDCPAIHDVVRDDTITRWKHVMTDVDRVLTTLGIKPEDTRKT